MSRPGRSAHIGACGVAVAGEPAAMSDEAGRSAESSDRLHTLAVRLRELGAWDHLPVATRDRRQAAYANDQWVPASVEPDEGVFCDGEELDEGQVDRFLEAVAVELRERAGVELPAFRLEADGLRIGVDHFVIWPDDRTDWYRTTMRTLGAVNFVLDQKGSAFRLVVAYAGGNEAIVWVMHPEVARAVNESGAWGPRETLEVPSALAPT